MSDSDLAVVRDRFEAICSSVPSDPSLRRWLELARAVDDGERRLTHTRSTCPRCLAFALVARGVDEGHFLCWDEPHVIGTLVVPARTAVTPEMLSRARIRFETIEVAKRVTPKRDAYAWTPEDERGRWLSLCRHLVECTLEWKTQPRVFVARTMGTPLIPWRVAGDLIAPEKIRAFDPTRLIALSEADTCICGVCGGLALLVVEEFPEGDWDANISAAKYSMCTEHPHLLRWLHQRSAAGGLAE